MLRVFPISLRQYLEKNKKNKLITSRHVYNTTMSQPELLMKCLNHTQAVSNPARRTTRSSVQAHQPGVKAGESPVHRGPCHNKCDVYRMEEGAEKEGLFSGQGSVAYIWVSFYTFLPLSATFPSLS